MRVFRGRNSPRTAQRQIERAEDERAKEVAEAIERGSRPDEELLRRTEEIEMREYGRISPATQRVRRRLEAIKAAETAEGASTSGERRRRDTGETSRGGTRRERRDTGESSKRR